MSCSLCHGTSPHDIYIYYDTVSCDADSFYACIHFYLASHLPTTLGEERVSHDLTIQ